MLGRSLDDLPPQSRRVLSLIETLVADLCRERSIARSDARFTRRELRARCGMSDTACRVHLERLLAMEYVRVVVGRNGARFEYELLFDGDLERSAPQMIGLIDVEALAATTATLQGQSADLALGLQAARTDPAPPLQGAGNAGNPGVAALSSVTGVEAVGNGRLRDGTLDHRTASHSRLAPAPSSSSLAASSLRG